MKMINYTILGFLVTLLSFEKTSGIVQPNGCKTQVDIVVILDQSSEINPRDYKAMKELVIQLVGSFGISPLSSRISLVLAYHEADVILHLDELLNETHVINMVEKLFQLRDPYIQIGRALRVTRQEISGPRSRMSTKKVAVILTNGKSRDSFMDEANLLHKETDSVFAIGVGRFVDKHALSLLASSSEKVFMIKSQIQQASNLENIAHNIMDITCRVCSIDAVFLVDVGLSAQEYFLSKIKQAMMTYIRVLSAGPETRFAIVEASTHSQVALRFENSRKSQLLRSFISGLDYKKHSGQIGHLGDALSVVLDDIFSSSPRKTKKLLVVFSNGFSGDSSESMALQLHGKDVFVHVYSYGNDLYLPNLVSMASGRNMGNVFRNSNGVEENALTARTSLCGGCEDKTIFCGQMALWGLCRKAKVMKLCAASCRVCYNRKEVSWMMKWRTIMRQQGPQRILRRRF